MPQTQRAMSQTKRPMSPVRVHLPSRSHPRRPFREVVSCAAVIGWCLHAVSPELLGAQEIRGLVLEEGSYAPVDVATVIAVSVEGDSVAQALTSEDGFFSLSVPTGEFILRVSALGYRPARAGPFALDAEDAVQVAEVAVSARPLELEGVVVDADRAMLASTGFFDRMAEGRGQFLTPDDLADIDARTTPEVFYDLERVVPQWSAAPWERWIEYFGMMGGRCQPEVWIDGVWFRWRLPGEGLDDVVPVENLVAAEVYWGPFQAPLRFQGTATDNSCGVVLLWTR